MTWKLVAAWAIASIPWAIFVGMFIKRGQGPPTGQE